MSLSAAPDDEAQAGLLALATGALRLAGADAAAFAWPGRGGPWLALADASAPAWHEAAQVLTTEVARRLATEPAPAQARLWPLPTVSSPGMLQLQAIVWFPVVDSTGGLLCTFVRSDRSTAAPADLLPVLAPMATAAAALLRGAVQTALREADRRRLRDFARASGDWLWECDAELRYTWIGGAYEVLTGRPAAALIGRTLPDEPLLDLHGEPVAGGRRLHQLFDERKAFVRAMTEERAGDEQALLVSRSAVPFLDDAGRLAGWRGTARDVGNILLPAREARARDERLRQLTDLLPGGIYQYCDSGGSAPRRWFPFVNDRASALFGESAEALRRDADPLLGRVHPADRLVMKAETDRSRSTGQPWRVEYRLLNPDGSERWLEGSAVPQALADGGTLWHGFCADVTERKRTELALRSSEERWQMAADATGIGILHVDLGDRSLRLDRQGCANFGLAWPHAAWTLDDWLERIASEDREGAAQRLHQAIDSRTRLEALYRFRRDDGSQHWIEVFVRAQYDAEGRATALIGTCRDVTEQHESARMQREKIDAERASRAKSELLSRVSHELRTPLNGILGFAQLMALDRSAPLEPAQRRRLDGVQRAGRHLLGLVNDVLDLTRIERGDMDLKLRSVDLVRALDISLVLVQPLAAVHRVLLPTALPRAPCWVHADARALEQVLINLLSNAIQYNRPEGSVSVELQTFASEIAISVGDEGAGLTEAQLGRLFQPFERLGAERQGSAGSGLGLAIARQLSGSMRGRIDAASKPGAGSRFTLTLQRALPADHDSGPTPLATAPMPLKDEPAYRVVYIEDEPLNALLMEEVFRAQPGWSLAVERDGASGLATVRELQPDIVLIDMNLPDMTGLQIIATLRAEPATAGLRCIALSADAMPEQIEAARKAGFDDYWTKPIDVGRMLQSVAQAIATPRATPK